MRLGTASHQDRIYDHELGVALSRAACAAALEEIEGHFRRMGAPVLDYLKPGLTDAEMDALTEPHGFHLPDDVRAWWAWHNGTRFEERGPFHSAERWLSIQSGGPQASLGWALDDRLSLLDAEHRYGADDMPPLWTPTWLKLTTFQDSWAVDMGTDYKRSRVLIASPLAGYPERARTLREFLQQWLALLDDEVVAWRTDTGSWDYSRDARVDQANRARRAL